MDYMYGQLNKNVRVIEPYTAINTDTANITISEENNTIQVDVINSPFAEQVSENATVLGNYVKATGSNINGQLVFNLSNLPILHKRSLSGSNYQMSFGIGNRDGSPAVRISLTQEGSAIAGLELRSDGLYVSEGSGSNYHKVS